MLASRAWAAFEPSYRAREIEILAGWIVAGESGCVVGLTGSGKSNLLGFMCQRPGVVQPYLPDQSLKLALVLVDLNNLPGSDAATFYRVMLRALSESRAQLPAPLAPAVERLYRQIQAKPDSFLVQSALREALLLFQAEGVRLVLVLDPFDQFCRTAEPSVLDNLRGLRDSFKVTLSYLVGVRHELAYLRDPQEIGEIYELLETHLCWVGAMMEADACWVINQVAQTTGRSFTQAEMAGLIELTGNYPSLLKAASLWLAGTRSAPEREAWPAELLAQRSLQYRLEEIWIALTQAEQLALCELQKWRGRVVGEPDTARTDQALDLRHGDVLARLTDKGLCDQSETGWRIRSELLAAYVATVEGRSLGRIWLDEATDTLYQGQTALDAKLTPLERGVLVFLVKHPYTRHTKTELIINAWADDLRHYGVADQSLYQLVLELRKKIEPTWTKPRYLITWRGKPEGGYQFFPEGRPG